MVAHGLAAAELGQRAHAADPGVVDQHVDASVVRQHAGHGRVDASVRGDVEREAVDGEVGEARDAVGDVGCYDAAAESGEGTAVLVADAALATPSNEHHRRR
jgi:hypothetical protein